MEKWWQVFSGPGDQWSMFDGGGRLGVGDWYLR